MEDKDYFRIFGGCLSGLENKIDKTSLEALTGEDWDSIVERSIALGTIFIVYHAIKDCDPSGEIIPPDIEKRLKKIYLESAIRSVRLFAEASRLLKDFNDANIPVIALKGLSLAEDLYGDIAMRPMVDIDLLIKKEDMIKAGKLLLSRGYDQHIPSWEKIVDVHYHLLAFIKRTKQREMVELHRNIVRPESPFSVDANGIWERARPIRVAGSEALAMSFEDLLIHLCFHAVYHQKFKLIFINFCDIARLMHINGKDLDWPWLVKIAREWGLQKCVYLTLCLTREILGAPLPDNEMDKLKPDDFDPVFLDYAKEQIFSKAFDGYPDNLNLSKIIKSYGIYEGTRFIFRRMFPSREFMASHCPVPISSPKLYLYYVSRLYHLAINYCRGFLLISRDKDTVDTVQDRQKGLALYDWMETK